MITFDEFLTESKPTGERTDMTFDEFARRLVSANKEYFSKDFTAEDLKNSDTTKSMYERGFSMRDALQYWSHSEELNPDMDEDEALAVMNKIDRKYK